MRILITGATGFIGRKLVHYLLEQTDLGLCLAIRESSKKNILDEINTKRVTIVTIGDISENTDWRKALSGCNVVIHTAARVHMINDQAHDPLLAFRKTNVQGTLNLARQASLAGVRRFIYLSSIKVNGEYTQEGLPFSADDKPKPIDSYSISKHEAEQGLLSLSKEGKMDVVIIRPPLVYGPGVEGNFLRMLQLMQKRLPMPFGALQKNKRSFVSLDNLVGLIRICITHPQAANEIFLVSDGDDVSTADLLYKIRRLFGNRVPLLPVPSWLLNMAAIILGKQSESMRLCGSLQVDISKSRALLNWQPADRVDDALHRTVRDYESMTSGLS